MSDYGIRLEYVGERGRVALVTIDRPDRKNAFNDEMFNGLEEVSKKLEKKLPRVVVITGKGDAAFSAGFDVNPDNPQVANLMEAVNNNDIGPCNELIQYIRGVADKFAKLPVPTIAAINGLAYGGGAELALRCDMRVMDSDAVICFSEVKLGLIPDWGGGPALTRTVGPAVAADIVLTARRVDAKEALQLGIVSRVTKKGEALSEALALAETISKNGPRAVRSALVVIRNSPDLPLDEAMELETSTAAALTASGECIHGITAFLTKKVADFPDK